MRADLPPARVRAEVSLPLSLADGSTAVARAVTFTGLVDGREHVALGLGPAATTPLVRLHSECLTGDAFGSRRCDCGPQLDEAFLRVSEVGGWVLYLRQEGRGIGLYNKLDAYVLQDLGLDTYDANTALGRGEDERDYRVAAQMLHALGVPSVALLSNNRDKARQLAGHGIEVRRTVPTGVHVTADNARYLAAKVEHGSHDLVLPSLEVSPAGAGEECAPSPPDWARERH